MSDIALGTTSSGYNLSIVNSNFSILETIINSGVLHLAGGNNQMNQDLDMNGFEILNTNTGESGSSLVTRQDLIDLAGDTVSSPILAAIGTSTVREITTDYSVVTGDSYDYFRTSGSGAVNFTMTDYEPELGAEVHLRQQGTGLVTVVAGTSVTINTPYSGTMLLAGTGATVSLKHAGSNVWDLIGQVSGA